MARYIVNNSKFKPFSFQEMLQPVLAADTEHKAIDESMGELRALAGVWENLANSAIDLDTYNMYKSYANDLLSAAAELSTSGLTPLSRAGLNTLRERYANEITPIEQSYAARSALAKELQALMNADPNVRIDRMAVNTSLRDYINDPSLGYRSVSGTQLLSQVATAGQQLAREARENPEKYKKILGGQYFEVIERNGFTAEEVNKAITDPLNANPVLTRLVDDVMESAGLNTFTLQLQDELRGMASQGLYHAIGKTDSKYMDNWAAKMAAQEAQLMRLMNYKKGLEQPDPTKVKLPYRFIPETAADKLFIKTYGGENLLKTSESLRDIQGKNTYKISNEDIINRMNERKAKGVYDTSSANFIPRVGTAGAPMMPDRWKPDQAKSARDKELDRLADSYNTYGVDNLRDLQLSLLYASEMTAKTLNHVLLELTDTKMAKDAITEAINSSLGFNQSPLYKEGKHGERTKALSKDDTLKALKKADNSSIVYDTKNDEYGLILDGTKYILLPELVNSILARMIEGDPNMGIAGLKLINPENVSILNPDGSKKPYTQYYNEYMTAALEYEARMKDPKFGFLSTWNGVFNDLALKQRGTEGAKD